MLTETQVDEFAICDLSLSDQAAAVSTKALSPVDLVEAVLSRIERVNRRVSAYCAVLYESARRQAKAAETAVTKGEPLGPLHGVPIAMKDIMLTKGVRTTFGSKVYESFIPDEDSVVVERLNDAGAIMVGKTNVPEFALSGLQTENLLFGATRNPWNLAHSPGGSSGGSAAAVASRLASLAIGSDSAGSIRMPASFCGVFGLKASFGRVPRYPRVPPGWETVSHTGPITRTVKDAALALDIIGGRDDRDCYSLPETSLGYASALRPEVKGLRIAWARDLYTPVDPEVMKLTEAAVRVFADMGAEIDVATPRLTEVNAAFTAITAARMAFVYDDILRERRDELHPNTIRRVEALPHFSAADYVRALMTQLEYTDGMRRFFDGYDLMLTPTSATPAPKLGEWSITEIAGIKLGAEAWQPFAYAFNITGQPAASVPCGWTKDGLPVGLQIIGRRFDDLGVLNAAAAFEQAAPWGHRRPAID